MRSSSRSSSSILSRQLQLLCCAHRCASSAYPSKYATTVYRTNTYACTYMYVCTYAKEKVVGCTTKKQTVGRRRQRRQRRSCLKSPTQKLYKSFLPALSGARVRFVFVVFSTYLPLTYTYTYIPAAAAAHSPKLFEGRGHSHSHVTTRCFHFAPVLSAF